MKLFALIFTMLMSVSTFAATSQFGVFLGTNPFKVVHVEVVDDAETAEDTVTFKIDLRQLMVSIFEPQSDAKQIADYVLTHYAPADFPKDAVISFQASYDEAFKPNYLQNATRAALIEKLSPIILKMGVQVSLAPGSKLASAWAELEMFRQQIEKPYWM